MHNVEGPQNLLTILEKQLKIDKLYPVHRLDKETSGVQLLATNKASAYNISSEFQKNKVKKYYVGILRGRFKQSEGVWASKLSDKAEGRNNPQGITADRVPCETRYKVLQSTKYFSYCQFELITGRQHQIRKHATLDKHSLIGDQRYGDKSYNKKMSHLYKTERMFLHSQKIEIFDMVLESPIPEDFTGLLK